MSGIETFRVRVNEFEGPLDLLLTLIEKKKMCVNDVSLAEITDSFLEHLRQMENYSFEKTSDFIAVAATLILAKSLSLLPTLSLTSEEHSSIDDLEERLRTYKRIKELSLHIRERFGKMRMFGRGDIPEKIVPSFKPSDSLTLAQMADSMRSVLAVMPRRDNKKPEVRVKKALNLEDVVADLIQRAKKSISMSFKDFVANKNEKVNIIVSFLAMLELVKRGSIMVRQEAHFDDISIETQDCDTPRYG
jgi:segregation and condensation protein A